ncbi:MAG: hypothetical protein PHU71_01230 [Candidatus Gracilibacteria bacterium]|nr:hypothetical protein [Candidatus Gracilibacteria bacterium]
MAQDPYTEHPLYQELYDYADQLFEFLDENCAEDSAWPNALDLDEIERHLMDAVSQLSIAINIGSEDSRTPELLELLGHSFNNLRIVENLLRNILLDGALSGQEQEVRAALNGFLKRGITLERLLLKLLNEVGANLKLI